MRTWTVILAVYLGGLAAQVANAFVFRQRIPGALVIQLIRAALWPAIFGRFLLLPFLSAWRKLRPRPGKWQEGRLVQPGEDSLIGPSDLDLPVTAEDVKEKLNVEKVLDRWEVYRHHVRQYCCQRISAKAVRVSEERKAEAATALLAMEKLDKRLLESRTSGDQAALEQAVSDAAVLIDSSRWWSNKAG